MSKFKKMKPKVVKVLKRKYNPNPKVFEKTIQIQSHYFTAGVVMHRTEGTDWTAVRPAPIVKFLKGWGIKSIRKYCKEKKWKVTVL